jgi:hypothetical protein
METETEAVAEMVNNEEDGKTTETVETMREVEDNWNGQ